jgi:hypothetical protein
VDCVIASADSTEFGRLAIADIVADWPRRGAAAGLREPGTHAFGLRSVQPGEQAQCLFQVSSGSFGLSERFRESGEPDMDMSAVIGGAEFFSGSQGPAQGFRRFADLPDLDEHSAEGIQGAGAVIRLADGRELSLRRPEITDRLDLAP